MTSFDVEIQPEDKGKSLKDIIEDLPSCPIGIAVRDKSMTPLRIGGRNSPFDSKQVWDSPFKRVAKKSLKTYQAAVGIAVREKQTCIKMVEQRLCRSTEFKQIWDSPFK